MKKIVILIVACLLATAGAAKNVSPRLQRDFNRKAYEVIKTYVRASQLNDAKDIAQFCDLFESQEMKICNDLMGLSYEPVLTVMEYVELLSGAELVTVGLRDVKKEDDIIEEDGNLMMVLSFLKRISFASTCNTFFDSYDFFGKDYHMQMTLIYDPVCDDCRIHELISYGPRMEFPSDYRVLEKIDNRDENLDINGKYFKFLNNQKILRSTDRLFYRGAKVEEKDMPDQPYNCDRKVFADYNDKSWRLRFNGGFSVAGFNKLGNSKGVDVNKNSDMSFGLDFGYVFPSASHLRFAIFTGVGISRNNIELSMTLDSEGLQIENPYDEDGDEYIRVYKSADLDPLKVSQTMSATDVTVPLYMDMEYEFNSIFSVYADAGLKLTVPMSHDITVRNTEFKTYGIYSKYGDLIIDDLINDFGPHNPNSFEINEDAASPKTVIDLIAGLGLRINLTKFIAIDAGVQYQVGGKSWTATDATIPIFSYDKSEDNSENRGVDRVNLMNRVGSLSHSAIKANISLILKF